MAGWARSAWTCGGIDGMLKEMVHSEDLHKKYLRKKGGEKKLYQWVLHKTFFLSIIYCKNTTFCLEGQIRLSTLQKTFE